MTRRVLTDAERIVSLREVIEAARGDWHEATALLSVGRDLHWLLDRASTAPATGPGHAGEHDFDGRDWCRLCRAATEARFGVDDVGEPMRALIESWEASAQQIDERTFLGDPAANIATANTLRSCANRLRAALATTQPERRDGA